jgi:DNA polymerase III subunit epsilon
MLNLFGRGKKSGIEKQTLMTEAQYAVVDLELTGLDERKDSIVSIGVVRMRGGVIDLGNTFYRLVSPRTELKASSVVIHEITPSEVAEEPSIEPVLGEFLDFCGDAVLVGHFVDIDLGFLNREMKRIRGMKLANHAIDTISIYEWLRKRNKSGSCPATLFSGYRLYDIVKCYGIPVNGAHNALMDAFTTAQLLQRFLPLLQEAGAKDISDLLMIGMPFKGGDRFGLLGEFGNF